MDELEDVIQDYVFPESDLAAEEDAQMAAAIAASLA